jgi:hypothetical protein
MGGINDFKRVEGMIYTRNIPVFRHPVLTPIAKYTAQWWRKNKNDGAGRIEKINRFSHTAPAGH